MDSTLFRDIYKEFYALKTLSEYKVFFAKYDFWILSVPLIRLKDKVWWEQLWIMVYEINISDKYSRFEDMLQEKKIDGKKGFLDMLATLFDDIVCEGSIPFNHDNDLAVIFSDRSLEDILCFCKTIQIHSWKWVKEFTQETCLDSIYYHLSTKENGYADKISYNEMMKDVCKSFLQYLEETTS